jgi:hypothetical protein
LSHDEHDSDAVYIDRVDVVLSQRSALDDTRASLLSWTVAGLCLPTSTCADPPQEALNRSHAPPPRGYVCPLYLWQLSLLI